MKLRYTGEIAVYASALLIVLPCSAHAQIAVEQTLQIPGNGGANIVQAFTVNETESVLIVGLYQDGTTVNYVRFGDGGGVGSGDQAADLILTEGRAALAYFFNPSTNSGLSIRIGNGANGFVGAWVLSGVDLSTPPVSDTDNSITTTEDAMFIVSWASANGSAAISADNGSMSTDVTLFQDNGTGSGVGGSLAAATAGAYNVGWANDNEGYGPFALAFATAPVGLITFSSEAASTITTNTATVSAQLIGTDSDVRVYWEAGSVADPSSHTGWDGTNGPSAESVGSVSLGVSNLVPDTLYSFAFHGTNNTTETEGWSLNAGTFSSAFSDAQAPSFTAVSQVDNVLKVAFAWQDNAANETAYLLQRATNGGSFATVASISADTVAHTDVVSSAAQYVYRLAATNSANSSGTGATLCETNITVTIPALGIAQAQQVTDELDAATWVSPFEIASANAVLVVGVYSDGTSFGNFRFGDGGGVGSGDQAADAVITQDRGALAYFLNPSTGPGLAIRADIPGDGCLGAWELTGMDLSGTVITSKVDTITTSENDMFIVSWSYANGDVTLSPGGSSDVELPIDMASKYAGGSTGSGAGGSKLAPTAGSYNVAWNSDGSGSPLAFAFAKAPVGNMFLFR